MFNCLSVQFQYNGEVQPKAFWENHSKIDFDCFVFNIPLFHRKKIIQSIYWVIQVSTGIKKKKNHTGQKRKEKKSC